MDEETEQDIESIEEDSEDAQEDSIDTSQEIQQDYLPPMPEDKINQWTFLGNAVNKEDTVRTTYLTAFELGKPLFTVRFLMDLKSLAYHYLNDEITKLQLQPLENNYVAKYFENKVRNISDSGMSNGGFTMNLSVTKKTDNIKKRIREVAKDGGKAKP